ncbi:transcription initiation factor IIE, beta subunit [Aaosphaeria arxii CBS 175.79]|uniref:Transcription initiation factor IIE subunit beta n=1 Tax=Aaosphaeria arxii CBS 175.79 TaxID=1450172 RepID=A0A6A5Y747_9PLEO|nr:transcription initiation factor IIE, beta subunit [Aaosphaeria arxii CBS 175.79]KAF2021043.1 transcription initiation factor IIE, beta subunit [Aaosphaeria arxii CBS 175.79]
MSYLKTSSASHLSAPSPTPSTSSTGGGKRKREDAAQSIVYSQPQETGTGSHLMTQVTYTIEHLRKEQRWLTLQEILDFLNLQQSASYEQDKQTLIATFHKKDPKNRIEYDAKTKRYRYKPKVPVRNADDLKSFLQKQKSAQGLSVKDLKDGWPSCQEGITKMEQKKEILVNRLKKDNQAKTVWINDPTLMYPMDTEFKEEWLRIQLPANPDDLRNRLIKANLKPSSAPREAKTAKAEKTKRKAARRGGKQTNTHMANILKDFSHLRK